MKRIIAIITGLFIAESAISQLYISSGAGFTLSDNAQVTLQNMSLVDGGSLSIPGNGRFVFNGSDNNEISGIQKPAFAELEIAKTGSGLLTLQTDVDVKNKIVFTSNLIELNNHNIDLGTTGLLDGENENSRITGINGGQVIASAVLDAPSNTDPANLGLDITSAQNLGTTTIRRGHQPQSNSVEQGSSIYRYFDIIPANNTNLNATLSIHYFDAEKNSLDENNFEIWKSEDNNHWFNMGQSARDINSNYVEQTGINSFSRWTLSTTADVLPVNGLLLSGQWKKNAAYLNWITLTEYNNSHFNIERKYNDEFNFATIGRKNSKYPDGNSQTATVYNMVDIANSGRGPIRYRIQQADLDNNYSYSNIIIIKPESRESFIEKVYPNISVKNQLFIKTGNRQVDKMQVFIYDMKGSLLFSKQLNYQSQWLALPEMNAGNYELSILSGENHWTGSFMKE